eukprot:404213-Alexandrium_andersonii.AAC.1
MIETASTCLPRNEPEALQSSRKQGLPARWGHARATHTTIQFGTHPGFRHFRGQRHIDIALFIGVQACLADIDQQGFAGPTAAPVLTGPPT